MDHELNLEMQRSGAAEEDTLQQEGAEFGDGVERGVGEGLGGWRMRRAGKEETAGEFEGQGDVWGRGGDHLFLFAESISLDQAGHNREWVQACWGGGGGEGHGRRGEEGGGERGVRHPLGTPQTKGVPARMVGEAVVCSGLVAGSPEAIQVHSKP